MHDSPASDTAAPAPRRAPQASERALHTAYDTALLDLDGVVYAGGEAVPHAVDSLAAARGSGLRTAYVTNNAARTPQVVAAHLTELGVPAAADEVVTSAQAVARLVAERMPHGARVLAVGAEGLRAALAERELTVVETADEEPAAVVQGYGGPSMEWGRLVEAALAVQRGVPWFASNTDLTIPSGRGIAPGNGSAVEVVRLATRWMRTPPEPEVAGKPLPPMHRESILRTGARHPLVVGDRLDTDIEGAHAGGVDSLLVLTGVTDAARLLAASPVHRPTYVARDLRGLLEPQPEVTVGPDGAAGCGGWSARAEDGRLEVAGDGDPADGLRALCGAAWSTAGTAECRLDAEKALTRLGF
ncbi:HAD hydrolase-like protein [Streptomyces sp. NPDC006992]|uniref:HAD hydrolase-like protein n=1 Tax=unclassified Streptomyces TaxID=2593676 RepID=UPI00340395DD